MHHNFVGSFKYLMDSKISEESFNRIVHQIAISTMHLKTIVDDEPTFVSSILFGHRAVHSIVWCFFSNQSRSMSYHKSRGFKLSCHMSKFKLNMLVLTDRLPKLFSLLNILGCSF